MALDLFLLLGVGVERCLKLWFEALSLLHKNKFPVLDVDDDLLGHLDLVSQGGEFLVLAGLELLVLVAGDLVLLGLHLDLELLAFNLDLPLPCACCLEAVIGGLEFTVAGRLLCRERGDFCEDGPEFLVAVLKGEEFFD